MITKIVRIDARSLAFAAITCLLAGESPALSVVNSKHDLSFASTGGGIKTTNATQTKICVYCHTPHRSNQNVPLWNKVQTSQTFTFYWSDYMQSETFTRLGPTMAMPAGQSKLCLSCHDGVTAVGSVSNLNAAPATIAMSGLMPALSNMGTDLTGDHPVRYPVDTAKDSQIIVPTAPVVIYSPATGLPTALNGGLVECTSCHDPHDNVNTKFLVMSNANGALCKKCHNMGPGQYNALTIHDTVVTAVPSMGNQATNALSCMGCHRMHGANTTGGQRYLLRDFEENTCYACHDGTVASTTARSINIKAEFTKANRHNIETDSTSTLKHKLPETTGAQYTTALAHSECVDCHNPHEARQTTAAQITPGTNNVVGAINGVSGVVVSAWPAKGTAVASGSFTYIQRITKEYQLCMKCHTTAMGAGLPAGTTDASLQFNINNDGYHSVIQVKAVNTYCNGSTMQAPWNTAGGNHTMRCSDCHRDDAVAATTPRGPHGSGIARILYASPVPAVASPYTNPLCVKCHTTGYYAGGLSGQSHFGLHPGVETGHRTTRGCNQCHGHKAGPATEFHGYNFTQVVTACPTAALPARYFINNTGNDLLANSNLSAWDGTQRRCRTSSGLAPCNDHTCNNY